MSEETQTSGRRTGATDSVASLHQREHDDWKRRQALQPGTGTLLVPTLPERISRLNPSERYDLQRLIRGLKLRKIIKRTLAEAFWLGEQRKAAQSLAEDPDFFAHSMKRLRAIEQAREFSRSYDRVLTSFEPVYTRHTYGDGNDPPTVTQALERSLLLQQGDVR